MMAATAEAGVVCSGCIEALVTVMTNGAGAAVLEDKAWPSVSSASRRDAADLLRVGVEVSMAHLVALLDAVEVLEAAPGCVGHPEDECG